jgi:hypothetical protein
MIQSAVNILSNDDFTVKLRKSIEQKYRVCITPEVTNGPLNEDGDNSSDDSDGSREEARHNRCRFVKNGHGHG